MHIELLKFTFFFLVTLDFLDWNFVKLSTTPCYIRQTFHVLMMIIVTL